MMRGLLSFCWVWTVNALAVPVFYDSSNVFHRDISYHPEQPERITVCVQALRDVEGIQLIDVADEASSSSSSTINCNNKVHQPFDKAELARAKEVLLQTHHPDLVLKLEQRCNQSKEQRAEEGKPVLGHMGYIDFDTYLTTESYGVCLRATAAWIRASSQFPISFVLSRPPGHHATYNSQNGFCIFNFAAATAIHAMQSNQKVSILDWDVHYGQGVSDIVKRHENVRYVSIHQTPAFPYMGERREQTDNVLTLPMPPDTTWTCGYKDLFETALDFVYNDNWKPELIIVCAGYDALASDELASTSLDASDYGEMTRLLLERVQATKPRIMLGLEGGYKLSFAGPTGNLPDAVVATVQALLEKEYS